jgi:hypothetical protein
MYYFFTGTAGVAVGATVTVTAPDVPVEPVFDTVTVTALTVVSTATTFVASTFSVFAAPPQDARVIAANNNTIEIFFIVFCFFIFFV